jgi:TonB-linked SusC/RagA family outer membrane protein
MVGSGSAIFIRGFNTISGSNQPLFVIDGIPIDNSGGGNALQTGVSNSNRAIDLNQDDIESISILKGPAAAVLYGSRAASGAIIISTKKGRIRSKNSVQYTNSTQWVEVNRTPDYQNQYAQGGVQGGAFNPNSNLSWGPLITGQTVTNFLGQQEQLTAYPSNVLDIFKTGMNIQNNISFTGGNSTTTFRLSAGNLHETGVIDNNKLVRNNFSFNANSKLSDKLTIGFNGQFISSRSNKTQQGNQLSNPLFRGWFLPRNISLKNFPAFNPDGSKAPYFDATDNPLWAIEAIKNDDYVSRFIGNINLKLDITSWMNITYRLGGDFYNQLVKAYDEIGALGQANTASGGAGAILEDNSNNYNYFSYLNLNFKKKIRDFDFNLIIGNEAAWRDFRFNRIIGRTLAVRGFRNLTNASVFNPSNFDSKQLLIGVYGDFSVGYKGIATLQVSGRNDHSSTFSENQRSFFYPAFAGTIDITQAIPSLRESKIINYAKLFANYAKVGKEAGPYATNTFFVGGGAADGFGPTISFPYSGQNAFTFGNTAGDANLSPEFTRSIEYGAELRFFNSRLGLEITGFKSNSTDIIFSVPASPSSGITGFTTNAGELETKGLELLLTGSPFKSQKFAWDISVNFSRIRTTTKKLAQGVPNIVLAGFVTPNARLEEGKPYGILFGSVFRRDANGELLLTAAGLPQLAADNAQIGDPNPDWTMGINNEISFKGITLSFLIDIRKGGDVFSRNIGDLRRSGVAAETAEFPRFNPDGSPTRPYVIPGVLPDGSKNTIAVNANQYWGTFFAFGTGESYVFDASWTRLRELSIGYKLPASMFQKSILGGAEFGLTGRNLFLHAPNFPHFDPENNVLGVSNAQGLEFNGLPSVRNIGFYLKLNL